MDEFEAMGLDPQTAERWRQAFHSMSVAMASSAAAFRAMVEAMRPLRYVPFQTPQRDTIMRRKLRRMYQTR